MLVLQTGQTFLSLYNYYVVNLLSQVIFVFLWFLGMVNGMMSANEVETKEKTNVT